ncbi:MAG TPA: hypothetical protein DEG17_00960 [Cyanobacteria bacterium UBA11149]|nr:hypothetical protein [Cyanobacteria bacterium UBA11367]HBE59089.1 hypothetical protein [Cyanobacteria bacterium UBA11366]HBK64125.1 hypothetical protein [Cyanobacteria bacterium UBA11166]HBR72769.1 hypothetical protein [Cyanobacteria bacterium UBA11159]HBS67947.1 hypothetical protein [Cyanobacteria bacterium UBA11153]HBW87483.1 hypothetical protein [Cyanobacteria bacterium UBA11149]HCA94055.1 hypothetical protein [Cyanobacteria bacterium UBA9226]
MLEKILYFITPGPMTETFRFRARVFYSWISLGIILGLIIFIAAGIEGNTKDVRIEEYLYYLFVITSALCLVALIGLGIDYVRKGNPEYQGWYWLLFPIITYLRLVFYFLIAIPWLMYFVGIFFLGIDIGKPKIKTFNKKTNPTKAKKKIRQEIGQQQSKDFLDKYGKKLIQQQPRKQLSEQDIKSLPIRERIMVLLENNPQSSPEDILKEEEMEELAIMLFESLIGC